MLRSTMLAIVVVGVALGALNKWQKDVLLEHNLLRLKAARGKPTAAFMPKLNWDMELASEAQKYADSCTWGHGTKRPEDTGENLATNAKNNSYLDIVRAWYDEGKPSKIDYNKMSNSVVSTMGRYTQMIWGKTTMIGCGYTKGCYNMHSGLEGSTEYLVCRYKPA